LHEFKLVNNKWWALQFTELRYSTTIFEKEKDGINIHLDPAKMTGAFTYQADQSIAVVDTGTSMMAIPLEDYNLLIKMWEKEIGNKNEFVCQMGLCVGGFQCNHFEKILSNISLVIENEVFEIMPKGYLLNG
jgi:hypothetical protein